jgi:hypothetical protein
VVGLEAGQLKVDGDAVGPVEALDRATSRYWSPAESRSPWAARTSPSSATVAGSGRRVAAGSSSAAAPSRRLPISVSM